MWDSTSKFCSAALLWSLLAAAGTAAAAVDVERQEPIELRLRPRVCTLSENDAACNTTVRAEWRSPKNESLCLVIVARPDVKRCWENYSQGTYTIQLTFAEDVTFQLRDVSLDRVLASEVLRVIREAIRYRHKRRQPWNIFD